MSTSPAKTIRGYELIESIGAGGFGVVYRAYQKAVDRHVAVKVILSQHAGDPEFIRRFEMEAQIIARLEHINIVPLYDFWRESDGTAYLVMRWMQSGSLGQNLEKGPWPLAKAAGLIEQIVGALAVAHEQGIVHRDLKPDNILLDDAGNAYLCDFGIAKDLGRKSAITQAGTTIGAVSHISPEQIQGEPVTPRTDIYSLGIILFELLTGRHPFPDTSMAELLIKHLQEQLPLLADIRPGLPRGLDDVIQQATAKDPLNRFADVRALLDAFRRTVALSAQESPRQTSTREFMPDSPERKALHEVGLPEENQQLSGSPESVPIPVAPASDPSRQDPVANRPAHNLPPQLTPLIGRETELTKLETLIGDSRLVTIVGPGGMGKTRLALAVARQQLAAASDGEPRFANGVFFVALDALDSAEQIPVSVISALGFRPSADDPGDRSPWQQTLAYLRSKRMLLIMDNFEQLLDGVDTVVSILEVAPEIAILVTSRERLFLRGEQLFPLQGLHHSEQTLTGDPVDQPQAAYPAPRLFVQSARRLRPEFTVEADELADMGEICRLVGGMPLALELAAGWVELLSLGDIVAEIKGSLDALETTVHDVPARQRSMAAVFEGSWQRLSQADQALLKQLSIFRGGFTRAAARQVAGASMRQLATLASKSLIQFDKGRDRFEMHRLLRQFLAEKLAADAAAEGAARDNHCAYFCAAVQQWAQDLKGGRQREAMVEMEADSQNIQVAWSWAVAQRQGSHLDEAVEGLCLFYLRSNRWQEIEEACQKAADRLSGTIEVDEQRVLAKILAQQGWFLDNEVDHRLVQESMDLLLLLEGQGHDVRVEKAYTLARFGNLKAVFGDVKSASELLSQSLTLYRASADTWGEADVLNVQGHLAVRQGTFGQAEQLFRRSLRMRKAQNDRAGRTNSLRSLASLAFYQGNFEETLTLYEECIGIFQEDHNLFALAHALSGLALAHHSYGQFYEAGVAYLRSMNMFEEFGFADSRSHLWVDGNEVLQGHYECARKYYPIEDYLADSPRGDDFGLFFYLGLAAIAESRYLEARQLWERCVAVCQDQNRRHEIGAALAGLALALGGLGKTEEATNRLLEAVRVTLATKGGLMLMIVLPIAAAILVDLKRSERAVEIYAVALQLPYVANAQFFEDVVGSEIATVAAALPPGVADGARRRGQELDPWETLTELQRELSVALAGSTG